MPSGQLKAPSPAAPAPLYERDLYAWSLEQAALLRAGRLAEIDAENIAEEILDVGKTEYRVLESALRVLLMHMLKWDHKPERRSRSWEVTILEQRDQVQRQLKDNPSLKPRLNEALEAGYRAARLRASGETDMDLEVFPESCPYDLDAILNRPFQRGG
jgi:hypothetical protein